MRKPAARTRGFTLLEVMIATLIMGIAVVGLLSNVSVSLRTASRLTDYDRVSQLARAKMDETLLNARLPKNAPLEGRFDPALLGGAQGGWRARIALLEPPPVPFVGARVLERVELEIWWMAGQRRRTFALEGFRPGLLTPEEAMALSLSAQR
jgi:general secretion pathway protein I